jgi:hypothetical protein
MPVVSAYVHLEPLHGRDWLVIGVSALLAMVLASFVRASLYAEARVT